MSEHFLVILSFKGNTHDFILVSTVYALSAFTEYQDGKTQHAWVLAMEAERYLGMAMGSNPNSRIISFVKTQTAAIGGVKSKAAEIQSKQVALEYYQKHITEFETMAAAAKQISEKDIAPQTIEIILRWLYAFHKENPDIPKPTKKAK